MTYAMCFFPMVGIGIGICEYALGSWILGRDYGVLFFSACMTLLPILLTGGIHLDGFMDTSDALASYGDREKKLAILKDSHTGAFAVLGLGIYLIWSLAMWSEVRPEMLPVLAAGAVLSRALSGFSVVTFPAAREDGLGKTFQDGSQKRKTRIAMCGSGCRLDGDTVPGVGGGSASLCSRDIRLLCMDEQKTVWRNDRGSGRIFSADLRTGDLERSCSGRIEPEKIKKDERQVFQVGTVFDPSLEDERKSGKTLYRDDG